MITHLQTYGQMLKDDPLGFLIYLICYTVAILISLILHECAHGLVALWCGDNTAKRLGRLSLRPSHHLDPMGTLFMVLMGMGWAKPVPINPNNFRNKRRDDFFVSIAGIITNFLLFLISMGLSVVVLYYMAGADFQLNVRYTGGEIMHLSMADKATRSYIFSLFSSYLLEGKAVSELTEFMAVPWLQYIEEFLLFMTSMNISLAVFNFLPIPPLDGYHLVNDTIFRGKLVLDRRMFMAAQAILVAIVMLGALNGILTTCISGIYNFFLPLFLNLIPA